MEGMVGGRERRRRAGKVGVGRALPQARQAAWLGMWRCWREVALTRGLHVLRWRALLKCFRT